MREPATYVLCVGPMYTAFMYKERVLNRPKEKCRRMLEGGKKDDGGVGPGSRKRGREK